MAAPIEILITVNFNDKQIQQIRDVSTRLKITHRPVKKAEDVPADDWAPTEILYSGRILPRPELVPNLRWVQFHFAGIETLVDSPLVANPDIIVTTLSGAAASQMGEHALMMMLALGHYFLEHSANQAKGEWPRDRYDRLAPHELRGSTVGIIGYGSVGRQIARLLQPFGVTVLAAKREIRQPEDTGYTTDGQGDPGGDFFNRLYPIQALKSMLPECDYVIVTVPMTAETRGLIGPRELAMVKPGAYLIDISRGGIVEPAALMQALQEKRLAGAALDVFTEEPLPATSPLWKLPNVIITPHVSGSSRDYNQRAVSLFIENINRYLLGLPLYNRYDPGKGY
jgi:phosphoglycerate dehydrogenase-like enzyme